MSACPYHDDEIRRPFASVAASQTDSEIWPAEAGKKLRVLAAYALAAAATALTFNRKPSGASGVAISPAYTSAAGVPTADLPYNPHGWFETNAGESLTVTTGAGVATGVLVVLAAVRAPDAVYDEARLPALLEDRSPVLVES